MDFDVIVLGDYCLDLIFTGLDEFPQLGKEIVANSFTLATGGSCNTAIALHRLGIRTGWACEFGNDEFSEYILEELRKERFPEEMFLFQEKPIRKITVSLSYPEDRAFIAYYDPGKMISTAIKGLSRFKTKFVYIPGLFYGEVFQTGAFLAQKKNMLIFMDGNNSGSESINDKKVEKSLKSVRFYSPNKDEAARITGINDPQKAAIRIGQICQTVIVKDGANGVWCCDKGTLHFQNSYKPAKIVDTTGAGDCFNAGFLKAFLDGRNIHDCLKWGVVAGGLSTQKAGANGYRITADEIQRIIIEERI